MKPIPTFSEASPSKTGDQTRGLAAAEVALIFLLFFLAAGSPPPAVNEAHYLAKAKHYWNPAWGAGDLFLESADAHVVFYWTIGWLTWYFSLPVVAWVGRLATWLLLAWSWRRLSSALVPIPLAAALSAGLFVALTQRFHMAGEWVIGGVEAKGFAYVLMFLGLEALVRNRWKAVWLLLGAASAFHVLVGGWSAVAAVITWCCSAGTRPSLRSMLPALLGGTVLSLPGILPALALTWQSDRSLVVQANLIYVFVRLDHHLVFSRIELPLVLRYVAILVIWLCLALVVWRHDRAWRRLQMFVAGGVAIGLAGAALDLLLQEDYIRRAALLRYYWFRLSDVMVPAGIALAVPQLLAQLSRARPILARLSFAAILLLLLAHFTYPIMMRQKVFPAADAQAFQPRARNPVMLQQMYQHWYAACRWISDNTEPDAGFLTPRYQQTFKWYAQRPEVFSWKDIPQDAAGIVQWWSRRQEIFPRRRHALGAHSDDQLYELARRYNVRYVLVDRTVTHRPLGFRRVYPNPGGPGALFEVYEVPDEPPE